MLDPEPSVLAPSRRRAATIALATTLFTYLTAEVFVAGALDPMHRELRVSEAAVGSLTSVYAAVAAGAILPVSALTRRLPARWLLAGAMLVLAVTSALCAIAETLPLMLAARSIAALCHGAVWASVPAVAAWIAPGGAARATARVFVGASAGSVLGAPAVAAVAGIWDWRAAAAGLATLSMLCAVLLVVALPAGRPEADTDRGREEGRRTRLPGHQRVLAWCGLVVLIAAAHLAAFTYVSDTATDARIGAPLLPAVLLAMGMAGLMATLIAGRLHDTHPRAAVVGALVVLALGFGLVGVSVAGRWPIVLVVGAVVWSAAYTSLTVSMQASVLHDAPGWGRRASAWYVLAFQLGIAGGAAAGGMFHGAARPLASGVAVVLALVAVLAHGRAHRR